MLAPDDMFQERYRISYVVDDQPDCIIYRAFDQQTQQPVFMAELAQPDDIALREAQTLTQEVAAVQVPGLLPLRQQMVEGLTLYLFADDPGGQDMSRAAQGEVRLKPCTHEPALRGRLCQLLRLFHVVDALHTHTRPLLLGDLHDADVWFSMDGELYVTPFAVVRPLVAGSSPYRAPELEDATALPTPISDVYALGAVSYHMLTGWPPPAASVRLAHDSLNSPRELNQQVDPLMERLVLRALHLDARERYQRAHEMCQAVELVYLIGKVGPQPQQRELPSAAVLAAPLPPAVAEAPVVSVSTSAPAQLEELPVAADHSEAAEEDTPADEPDEMPPPLTCLVITAVVLLLLAFGLSAAAYFFLLNPASPLLMWQIQPL